MERRVTVNDRIEHLNIDPPDFHRSEEDPSEEDWLEENAPPKSKTTGQGPCLYLGARGERCTRPALAGGYCAKHHADPELRSPGRNYTRVLVASVALILVVWPYLADALRDLAQWLASLR